jgi:hypothetical protein
MPLKEKTVVRTIQAISKDFSYPEEITLEFRLNCRLGNELGIIHKTHFHSSLFYTVFHQGYGAFGHYKENELVVVPNYFFAISWTTQGTYYHKIFTSYVEMEEYKASLGTLQVYIVGPFLQSSDKKMLLPNRGANKTLYQHLLEDM